MGLIKKNKFPGVIPILILVNVFTATGAFILASNINFPDSKGFWLMSEGINYGRFSSWYFLDTYYPETLRTPGYPLLLTFLRFFYDSQLFIKITQLAAYFTSLFLCYQIVNHFSNNNKKATVVYLSLTAINIQIPYYSGYITADIWCILFTSAFVNILLLKPKTTSFAILLGIIAGLNFLMRPAFLLFPFVLTLWYLVKNKSQFKYNLIHLFIFCITLLPFTYWNYKNHHSITPTPIEGGAGVSHIGYWSYRLPKGYQEKYYWGNVIPDDLTNPFKFTDEEYLKNKVEFEKEWEEIIAETNPLNKEIDLKNIAYMSGHNPGIFKLYNSEYTIAREKLLKKKIKEHIISDPVFYIKTRMYSFFRLYFTGINKVDLERSLTVTSKIKTLYPFLITFSCICIGFFLSTFLIIKNKILRNSEIGLIILLCLYQGVVHAFFTVQGRYLVPVHLLILILLTISVTKKETVN